MAINMDRYVKIVSSVTGASAVAQQQLTGRVFVDNSMVPADKIIEVANGGAELYFGANSLEAQFARQYFGYISPAPASQARSLQFASIALTDRHASFYSDVFKGRLADLQDINTGSFDLEVLGNTYNVSGIDLSSEQSLSDVASKVESEINAVASANPNVTVSYNQNTKRFIIVADDDDEDVIAVTGGSVANAMGFNNGFSSQGINEQDYLEALIESEQISDSFGSIAFLDIVSLTDAIDVANYVSGQNVKYQVYWSVDKLNASDWYDELGDVASSGLVLNETANEDKRALPMAIMSATDYDRTNAAINYMFRQGGTAYTADIRTDLDANDMDNIRVNYYGQTASAGQQISFFQRGVLCGGAVDPLDMGVHANEQWLKAYLKSQLMALLLTTNKIPANLDGRGMVLAIVQGGIDKALNNGTIITGKTLTELQKVAITQGTGDPLAWHDVQTNGYYYDAEVTQETGQSGVTEYAVKYGLWYSKGDSIRKIEGSHNLV